MSHKQTSKKIRKINTGPDASVATEKKELYRHTVKRINDANDAGFYLESVTLVESMITDRLEARRSKINNHSEEKRKFSTAGRLVDELCGERAGESEELKLLYQEVRAWADRRNEVLHQLAKLAEGDQRDWPTKYAVAKPTALDGMALFRRLDYAIRKVNAPDKSQV